MLGWPRKELWIVYSICTHCVWGGNGVRMKAICYPLVLASHQLHKDRVIRARRALNHLPGSQLAPSSFKYACSPVFGCSLPDAQVLDIHNNRTPRSTQRALKCRQTPDRSFCKKPTHAPNQMAKSLATLQVRRQGAQTRHSTFNPTDGNGYGKVSQQNSSSRRRNRSRSRHTLPHHRRHD